MKHTFLKASVLLGLSSIMVGCGSENAPEEPAQPKLPAFQQQQVDYVNGIHQQFQSSSKEGIPAQSQKIVDNFTASYEKAAAHFDANLKEVSGGIGENIQELQAQHSEQESLYTDKCEVGQDWSEDACNDLGEEVVEIANLIKKKESDLKNMEAKIGAEKKNALTKVYVDHVNKFKTLASKNKLDIVFEEGEKKQ